MRLDNRSITIYATHPTPKGVVAVGFFNDNGDPFERPWTALRNEPIRYYEDDEKEADAEADAFRAKPNIDDPMSVFPVVKMDPGGWTKTNPESDPAPTE